MLINWEDLKVGDEIIIPSNSNLKYLKVIALGKNSHPCSFQHGVTEPILGGYFDQKPWYMNKSRTCESDITKHNHTFYLKNDNGYKDIWLVKRDNNE